MTDTLLNVSLPSENILVLMVQNPRVLYVYWELSIAQRLAIAKKAKIQLRLNVVGIGPYRAYDIMPLWDSFYFNGVDPEREYYCDISAIDDNSDIYPLIHSNKVITPTEKPTRYTVSSDFWGKGDFCSTESEWDSISSEAYYK